MDVPAGWTAAELHDLQSLAALPVVAGSRRTAAQVRPLRPDQIRRLNVYATAAAQANGQPEPAPLAEDAPWSAVRERTDLDRPVLHALGVTPAALLASGADLDGLVSKGFDAAAIVADRALGAQMVQAVGATNVAVAVLTGAEAAVLLAGSTAMEQLRLAPRALLRAVATSGSGDTREESLAVLYQEAERHAVLSLRHRAAGQLPPRHYLSGIPIGELCAAGVDATMLTTRLGIPLSQLPALLGARDYESLAPLGVVVQQ